MDKKKTTHVLALVIEVLLTLGVCFFIVATSFLNLNDTVSSYAQKTQEEYCAITDRYVAVFKALTIQVEEKIEQDLSFDEMNDWLQSEDAKFAAAVGEEVFDGFALSYKGGYAHSWDYGDYTNYDPTTRPWYIEAAEANGEVAIVAPYVSYLGSSVLEDDQEIEMSISQRYNSDITFDLDIKISEIGGLLAVNNTNIAYAKTLLVDAENYILSTNVEEYYCHNLAVVDSVITADFSRALINQSTPEQILLTDVDGSTIILFNLVNSQGQTLFVIVPFGRFFVENCLAVVLVAVVLLIIEVLFFLLINRRISKLSAREERAMHIAEQAYAIRYDINLATMSCSYVRFGSESINIGQYEDIYNGFYARVAGEEPRQKFEQYFSPSNLKASHNGSTETMEFLLAAKDAKNLEGLQNYSISMVISGQKEERTASVLINNITEMEQRENDIFKSIAHQIAIAFVGDVKTRCYEIIKSDPSFLPEVSGIISENELIDLQKYIREYDRPKLKDLLSIDRVVERLDGDEPNDDITVASLSGHWYRISLTPCLYRSYMFVICMENVDEQMHKNEELKSALRAANAATQAKSRFLAQMSHDIRTPMNAIIGMVALARDHVGDRDEILDDLNKIDLSSHILLTLINDVLDMSAIEAGKLKIGKAPFDFKQLIESVTTVYYTQAKAKGIDFECQPLTIMSEILEGDQLRVNQILMNLISNAVKFTSKGSIKLSLEERDIGDNSVSIKFVIKDSGCGISEEMMGRLFKPFEQETAETAAVYGGSGLGLSIVYNLVTIMDGTISVESVVNQGTTFTVELPFKRVDDSYIGVVSDVDRLHVLAVDDDFEARQYISAVLDRLKIRYDCVDSAAAALAKLQKGAENKDDYNICILDWKMPDIDGVQLTKLIRERFSKDTVVIVMSAYDNSEIKDLGGLGIDKFISKPIFQSSLFDLFISLSKGKLFKNKGIKPSYDFSGKRVLLVEDNEINRSIAVKLLVKAHVVCDVATNGKEAVDKFVRSDPDYYDAILMDIQMPIMDGYAATRAIRSSGKSDARTIQIIALTADAFDDDVAKAAECGMGT